MGRYLLIFLTFWGLCVMSDTENLEDVRNILEDLKNILQDQTENMLAIKARLDAMESATCLNKVPVHVENQIENRLLKKFLNLISNICKNTTTNIENTDKSIYHENMKVEKKVKVLLPQLETYLTRTIKKINVINLQLNQTRLVDEGLWEDATKEVRATKDIFRTLNESRDYMEQSKILGDIWEDRKGEMSVLLASMTLLSQENLACDPGYENIGQFGCYRLHLDQKYSFEEALHACQVEESDLLEIRNRREYGEVLKRIRGFNVWMGIKRDFMGIWRWISSSEETVFTNWYRFPRRADGSCAYIDNTGQAGWFNYHCISSNSKNYRTSYVCKREGVRIDNLFGV